MTKDFKVADSSTSSSGQYGISWVLGGIAVGLLAGAAVYATMNNGKLDLASIVATPSGSAQSPVAAAPAQTSPTAAAPNATLQDKPTTGDSRPGFSYHAVLPQLELDVPFSASVQEETADPDALAAQKAAAALAAAQTPAQARPTAQAAPQAAAPQTAAPAAQPTAAQGRYLFQLGAYKTESQANQMLAKAKRNGLNTRVESTNINGEIWYRVRLGPTADPAVVNKWKQMLSGMGISPMIIRL